MTNIISIISTINFINKAVLPAMEAVKTAYDSGYASSVTISIQPLFTAKELEALVDSYENALSEYLQAIYVEGEINRAQHVDFGAKIEYTEMEMGDEIQNYWIMSIVMNGIKHELRTVVQDEDHIVNRYVAQELLLNFIDLIAERIKDKVCEA